MEIGDYGIHRSKCMPRQDKQAGRSRKRRHNIACPCLGCRCFQGAHTGGSNRYHPAHPTLGQVDYFGSLRGEFAPLGMDGVLGGVFFRHRGKSIQANVQGKPGKLYYLLFKFLH